MLIDKITKMKNYSLLVLVLLISVCADAQKILVPVDKASKIHFVIKNFGFNTGGDFSGMKGNIRFNPDKPSTSNFDVSVDAPTIDTDNGLRDKHLKKEDYFDVIKYPLIRLASKKVEATNLAGTYKFTGDLTLKHITKPVTFLFKAIARDNGYFFEGDFRVNRLDYTVGNKSATLSNDVRIYLSALAK